MMPASRKLRHIVIRIENRDTVAPVYAAICGSEPATSIALDQTARFTRFNLGASFVALAEPLPSADSGMGVLLTSSLASRGPGLHLVGLDSGDLRHNTDELLKNDIRLIHEDDHVFVHPESASGVLVQLTSHKESDEPTRVGEAHLDHVAIRVRDLAAASSRWELLCNSPPIHMGLHPVSNGSFEATRFLLHDQMIELVSPIAGKSSVVAERLRTHGEGVQTIALVARHMKRTLGRLRKMGVRLIRQDPHWFVHPGDAGGILIQLSPRIDHPS
jgi:catechol 2,3-dioxygenase-like lactoylglutathione lyase family enzyme